MSLHLIQDVTEWRMSLAHDHCRTNDLILTEIAELTGHGSP
jgi:hypothetical protein